MAHLAQIPRPPPPKKNFFSLILSSNAISKKANEPDLSK